MSKDLKQKVNDYSYTQNRELSWLKFNRRVLEEAADTSVPLLERLKFISIFSSNLDEFFMVRVGSLFDISLISPDEIDKKSGMTPAEQLKEIYNVIPGLIEMKKEIYAAVRADLEQTGIIDLDYAALKEEEQKFIGAYFHSKILPMLSPQIVGSHHPAPHLVNKALYIAALLKHKKGKQSLGFIPVPTALPSFIGLPSSDGRFIRLENIILHWAPLLFSGYKVESLCVLSVTRNADISFDNDKFEDIEGDFRTRVSKLLKKRASLSIVRLEINHAVSDAFMSLLNTVIDVKDHQIYFDASPLNMKYVFELKDAFSKKLTAPLLFSPYHPRWPEDLKQNTSMIEQIRKKDRLLFFPYDTVDPFLQLLEEAANRPDVVSIKITIYRLASSSKIAHTLCRAAENGKEVIVLMELLARFDEQNNITWSKLLEDAGCQVIYGIEDFKCHSKICLITMRGKGGLQYITQIGTGNYNEKTNEMYTDLSLMTASETIGTDGAAFFRNMLIGSLEGDYRQLLVAPHGIKSKLCEMIDRQIEKGTQGYICIKANSVTEREVIDKLKDASVAGVEIQLIIRGICCLRPGIPSRTENIHVTSIVGRFLEHARIYCFGKNGEDGLYIASADLMTRNLNRRVEIACPVYDPEIKEQLLWILSTQLKDNVKASFLLPDGSYSRKSNIHPTRVNSQEVFMEQSIHKEESIEEESHETLKARLVRVRQWVSALPFLKGRNGEK